MKIIVIDDSSGEVVDTYKQGDDALPQRDDQIWVTIDGGDVAWNVNRVQRDYEPNGGPSEHRVICEKLEGLEKEG